MTDLIEIKTDKKGIQTVSARLLHEKLKIKTRFNDWIERMIEYGCFEENKDFVVLKNDDGAVVKNSDGVVLKNEYGRNKNGQFASVQVCTVVNNGAKRMITDYAVSVDMAKQICMLQRSEIGRKVA